MSLRIKNYELETLAYFLYEMKLGTKKSRMRTRLLKLVESYLVDLREANVALIQEFAIHDENGQLIYEDEETKSFKLDPLTSENYFKELDILGNEEVVFEINEATQDMILTVAQSFLEEEVKLSQNEATIYDNICEQLEDILARYEHKEEITN